MLHFFLCLYKFLASESPAPLNTQVFSGYSHIKNQYDSIVCTLKIKGGWYQSLIPEPLACTPNHETSEIQGRLVIVCTLILPYFNTSCMYGYSGFILGVWFGSKIWDHLIIFWAENGLCDGNFKAQPAQIMVIVSD